jgi:hypothetical protein
MYPWSPLVSDRRLPVLGREGAEVVLVRHPGQSGENVLQVRQGVFSMAFAGDCPLRVGQRQQHFDLQGATGQRRLGPGAGSERWSDPGLGGLG